MAVTSGLRLPEVRAPCPEIDWIQSGSGSGVSRCRSFLEEFSCAPQSCQVLHGLCSEGHWTASWPPCSCPHFLACEAPHWSPATPPGPVTKRSLPVPPGGQCLLMTLCLCACALLPCLPLFCARKTKFTSSSRTSPPLEHLFCCQIITYHSMLKFTCILGCLAPLGQSCSTELSAVMKMLTLSSMRASVQPPATVPLER